MIRVVALLFFIGIAALAECVVYSTACKAGVDWHCYGKADKWSALADTVEIQIAGPAQVDPAAALRNHKAEVTRPSPCRR